MNLSKLIKSSSVYMIGDMSTKVLEFLLIPIYTTYLLPEEYGIISLATMIIGMMSIVFQTGQPAAAVRHHFEENNKESRDIRNGSIFLYLTIFPAIICSFIIFNGDRIFNVLFSEFKFFPYGFLTVIISYFASLPQLLLSLWKANQKPRYFAIFSFAHFLTSTILTLVFIVVLNKGAYGKLAGMTIAGFIFWVISIIILLRHIKISYSWLNLKKSLVFGVPLVFHALAGKILSLSDRYMIESFMDISSVGIYSLAYQLGSIMLYFSAAFDKAWVPFYYSSASNKNSNSLLSKIANNYMVLMISATFILSFFSEELNIIMSNQNYSDASGIIPIVSLGVLFNSLYYIPIKAFFYKNKTIFIPLFTVTAALVNIIFNIFLIPRYGIAGAAWATLIGYATMFFIVLFASQKIIKIQYDFKKILMFFFAYITIYCLFYIFISPLLLGMSFLLQLFGKIILVLAFLFLFIKFKMIDINEIRKIFRSIQHKK